MTTPPIIPLDLAREAIRSEDTIHQFLGMMEHLHEESTNGLGPLVFEVIALDNQLLAAQILGGLIKKHPEWIHQEDDGLNTPLMDAVKLNRLVLVDVLLDAGAQTDTKNKFGYGVLDIAGNLEASAIEQESLGNALLKRDVFTQEQKDRGLLVASFCGNPGMTQSLLAHGAGFSAVTESGTALALASSVNETVLPSLDVVRAMLQTEGARAVINDGWGNAESGAPLHVAALTGNVKIMADLIAAGACVNPPENLKVARPETPLMTAATWLRAGSIDLLIKSGCDVAAVDEDGCGALHYLASSIVDLDSPDRTAIKVLHLLVAAGADPLLKNEENETPLDIARLRLHQTLADEIAAVVSSTGLQSSTADPRPTSSARRVRL